MNVFGVHICTWSSLLGLARERIKNHAGGRSQKQDLFGFFCNVLLGNDKHISCIAADEH